ncbi:hypothetical protein H4R99_002890 [Coemansia sp. RSA 1722]|nr:hypothetical protein IWW45_000822 [Coemansia sp. RSA 485]KAJ2599930.1 hypothetical protein GGF39_002021 [Coemansia sp. RSA 1721]KAJ2601804.1 hypothetical protein H4R99_002890 [Coemansia sp. RSA 1722]
MGAGQSTPAAQQTQNQSQTQAQIRSEAPAANPKNPNNLKPCCVCLETKKARDSCFFEKGDEAEKKCHYLVLAHRMCMEDLGFKV